MTSRSAIFFALVIAVTSFTPAFAQQGGGLFGRATSKPKGRQTVDLTVTSAGSYDVDSGPAASVNTGLFGAQQPPGYSTTLDSAVDYAFRGRRVQLRMTGTSGQRYFRPLDNLMPGTFSNVSQSGAVQFSAGTRRTRIAVSPSGMLSSSPLYSLFTATSAAATPGEAPAVPAAYALDDVKSASYGTTVALAQQLGQRSSLSANVDWQHAEMYGTQSGRQVRDMYGLNIRAQQGVGRNTSVSAAYLYRIGAFDQGGQVTLPSRLSEHGIELGIDHRRRVSATRSVTLGMVLGGSAMLVPPTATAVTSTDQTYNRAWAQANFGYEFARGWQASAGYRQGVDYVVGLSQPVAAKSGSASMTGQVTRRVDVLTSAAYSTGGSAIAALGSVFDTYTGDARLRVAVARSFAVYVEYLYYFYDSRGTLPLTPGLPVQLERNTARVGLMLKIPTF